MTTRKLLYIGSLITSFLLPSHAQEAESVSYIRHLTPEGMTAPPHFSRVVVTNANETIYIAGMTGSDHNSDNELDEYRAQLREVYAKVGTSLEAAGATPAHVVRQRLSIVGIRAEYASITRAVMEDFYGSPGPASTAVGTTGLFTPGIVAELDVTAVLQTD
jgi:enamine deaminase RidA (YjgF/YER057c/UK114 family)